MGNKNIYLIRHTEVYNPNKLCFGQSEMPLEENFTALFDWINDHLPVGKNTVYYSGPSRRCQKLASYLSDSETVTDQRIDELNFGKWEMKQWNEIPTKEMSLWTADIINYKIKGGERFTDLYERSVNFYEEICTETDAVDIVIITHASVIRSVIALILGFPLEKAFQLQIDYSSISKVTYHQENGISKLVFSNLNAQQLKKQLIED